MALFPPPFYFVFDISNLLSYIQNKFNYELPRLIMGIIFLVGRAKRAPHWGVQSRFRVIYIVGMLYVCRMSNLLRRRNYVAHAHAQSLLGAVMTPVLFISYALEL